MTAVYSVYTHKPFNNSYFKRWKNPYELFKVYQLNSFKDNDIQVWTLTLGEHVYRKCYYGIEEVYKEICVPGMCVSRIHSKDMCAGSTYIPTFTTRYVHTLFRIQTHTLHYTQTTHACMCIQKQCCVCQEYNVYIISYTGTFHYTLWCNSFLSASK